MSIDHLEAKIVELGGQLIERRTWRVRSDEIEECDYRVGDWGVRLRTGMYEPLSVELKEGVDGPNPWRLINFFVYPEIETLSTTEQNMDWIEKHPYPGHDAYFAWLVEQIERFVGTERKDAPA